MAKRERKKRTNISFSGLSIVDCPFGFLHLYLLNTTQKPQDWAPWTPLNTWDELKCSGSVSSSWSASDTRPVTVKRHEHHLTWKSCCIPIYVNKFKKSIYKTLTPEKNKTNESKDEPNIVFTRIVAVTTTRNQIREDMWFDKMQNTNPTNTCKNGGELRWSGRVSSSCTKVISNWTEPQYTRKLMRKITPKCWNFSNAESIGMTTKEWVVKCIIKCLLSIKIYLI